MQQQFQSRGSFQIKQETLMEQISYISEIDVENIVTLNHEHLKKNFQVIITILKQQSETIMAMNKKLVTQKNTSNMMNDQINQEKQSIASLKEEIQRLDRCDTQQLAMINGLRDQLIQTQKTESSLQDQIYVLRDELKQSKEKQQKDYIEQKQQHNDHEKRITEITKNQAKFVLKEVHFDPFYLEFTQFKKVEAPQQFSDIDKQIQNLQKHQAECKKQQDDHSRMILENQASLNLKVTKETHQNDFQNLIARIDKLQKQSDQQQQSIQNNIERTSEVSTLTGNLQRAYDNFLNKDYFVFKESLAKDINQLYESKLDKGVFSDQLNQLNERILEINKNIQNLTNKIREQSDFIAGQKTTNSNVNGRLQILEKKVNKKQKKITDVNDLQQVRQILEEFQARLDEQHIEVQDIKKIANNKLDQKQLFSFEEEMYKKIDDIVGAIIKKCADKNETKKAVMFLEQKINQLYFAMFGDGQNGEDGLLVKKPAVFSCIACDKKLDKFKGKLGKYANWGIFPPKETSPEKYGRFGADHQKGHAQQDQQKLTPKSQSGKVSHGVLPSNVNVNVSTTTLGTLKSGSKKHGGASARPLNILNQKLMRPQSAGFNRK